MADKFNPTTDTTVVAVNTQTPILRRKPSLEPGYPSIAVISSPLSVRITWPHYASPVVIQRSAGRYSQTFADLVTLSAQADIVRQSYTDTDLVAGQYYAYRLRSDPTRVWSDALAIRTAGKSVDYTPPGSAIPRVARPAGAKWQLRTFDGSQTYSLEMNPKQQGNPWSTRELGWHRQIDGTYTAIRSGRTPVQWTFGGTLRSRGQYEQLRSWIGHHDKVLLVTDLGEVHVIRLLTLEFNQKGGGSNQMRGDWTVSCLLYDEVPLWETLPTAIT